MIVTFSRAGRGGLRSGLRVSAGVLLGDVVLVGVTLLAMLGLLARGDQVFTAMKWAGAAALLGLAVRMLGTRSAHAAGPEQRAADIGDIVSGAMLGASSPFNLVFMLALLPQFIPTDGIDAIAALLAGGAFLAGVLVAQTGATLLGAGTLRLAGIHGRWIEFAGGAALIAFAGAALLAPID